MGLYVEDKQELENIIGCIIENGCSPDELKTYLIQIVDEFVEKIQADYPA